MFKTIKENICEEIIEKKSRFISNCFYVESVDEAEDIIKNIRKEYYDAKHICFAYKITKSNEVLKKFSDDGEPVGTAGLPIMNIIEKNGLSNIIIVVTRYFGGILLGTGGLVRAYSEAALKSIKQSSIIIIDNGLEVLVELEYKEIENFKYYCRINNININETKYEETINCRIEVIETEFSNFLKKCENNLIKILDYKIIKSKYIRKNTVK